MTDCNVGLISVSGFSAKKKKFIDHSNLDTIMTPVPHDNSLPVKKPPEIWCLKKADEDATVYESDVESDIELHCRFEPFISVEPYLIAQSELTNLVRDFSFS